VRQRAWVALHNLKVRGLVRKAGTMRAESGHLVTVWRITAAGQAVLRA
jgi:DNA-binding PadR family transcriptional regulator